MKKIILLTIIVCFVGLSNLRGQGSWTLQNSGTNTLLKSVYFVSDDTGFVANTNGLLLKTTNGGQNWVMAGTGPCDALNFFNTQNGFATDGVNIIKTQDGGLNWTIIDTYPDITQTSGIHFPDNMHGYAIASTQNSELVLKTSNSGESWDSVYSSPYEIPYEWNMFTSIFFTDSLTGYIGNTKILNNSSQILKTTDGGYTWDIIVLDSTDSDEINSIHFPTCDTGYVVLEMGAIYKTTDAGTTWNVLPTDLLSPLFFSIFFTDVNNGCIVGGNGINTMTLFQTDDGGNSWYMGTSGTSQLYSVYFPSPDIGYAVGTGGAIYKYSSGSVDKNNVSHNTYIDIYPNPANNNVKIEGFQAGEIEIIDLQGQFIKNIDINDTKTNIDISKLSGGVYIIRIKTDDGIIMKKLVKE